MFEDIIFLLLYVVLPILWHYLLKTAGISLLRFSIPSVVMQFLFIFQYVGLPILYFQLDSYRFTSGVNDKYIILQVFFFTSWTITLMIIGFIIGKRYFGVLLNQDFVGSRECGRMEMIGLAFLFLICLSTLVVYLYRIGFNNIAFFIALGEGISHSAGAARSVMGNAFEGKYHWYYLFMNQLMQFSALAAFAQMLIRPNFSNKAFLAIVMLVTSFSLIMATEKAPMVNFLISIVFIYVLSRRNGFINIKTLAPLGILMVLLIVSFYIYFMGSGSPAKALSSAFSRIFTGGIQPAYHYLEFFPKQHEYLLGKSLPNPSGLLPFDNYKLAVEIMNWHKPDLAEQGIVGSMPAIYWAEMYANFGLFGIVIPPFFVGLFLYWLNSLLTKFEVTPISIAFYVWLAMHFKKMAISSLSSFLIDIYLQSTFAAFLIITFCGGRGRIKIIKRLKIKRMHA
jgi:hypothetical protein